jgi:penicillin-binding protein 2
MWQNSLSNLSSSIFTRRAFILVIGKLIIFGAIIMRLLILQVFKAKSYKTLSDKNRIKFIVIHPQRGNIKDVSGKVLAYNKEVYEIYFYKQRGKVYEPILKSVFDILGYSIEQRRSLIRKVGKASYLQPIVIKEDASWDNVARVEAETYRLPGVFVEKTFSRHYPTKANFAHVIGYTGFPSKKEIGEYGLRYAEKIKIGKTGIESNLNHSLIGKCGAKRVEVNANRVVVRDLSIEPSIPGNDVNLTINSDLQSFLHNLLPKSNSAAAVIDIHSGDILAMCSFPSFNPNLFSTEYNEEEWKGLMQNNNSPFINKVIGKPYPPGSTWKIVTSIAILEAGIDPEEKVLCNGAISVGNRLFRCAKTSGHGHVNLHEAVPLSCNCYFYKMGIRIGVENIYRAAKALGFGQKIGIELPGELSGANPNKLWKANSHHQSWTLGDTANTAIGQGFVLATPLQLLMMSCRVASGKIIQPSLIKDHSKNHSAIDLPFKKENLEILKKSLEAAINTSIGTSFSARIRQTEFAMAGKTGTAQVISRDTEFGGFHRRLRSHSMFTGYAPIISPRYAVAVVAENAGWGGATAAPIARDILLFAQKM